jgi:diguanylate cyclase (GGDEF)-like protein
VHAEDRARIEAIFQRMLVTGLGFEHEHRMVGTDGVTKMISATGSVFLDSEGRVAGVRGTVQDISERKQLEEDLRFQAFHDSLTNLPNRSGFLRRLEDVLVTAQRTGYTVTVLFLDLDRFKVINDSLGHMSGDQVLVAVSKRLTSILRDADTVARFGGDEFAVLLTGDLLPDEAERVAYRILDALHAPFQENGRELFVSTSIGIASSSSAVSEATHLLRAADVAMYHAKGRGPGSYAVFDLDMNAWAVERLELESDLQRAVERNELVLHYQPRVDLVTGAVVAVEALLRWYHPRRGVLYPGDFLQLAEESGLIVPIGRWALEEACRQAVAWRVTMTGYMDCLMCVNLSAREFRQPDLVAKVARVLEESGLPPRALELEITEKVAVDDDQAFAILSQLKEMGLHLALDDFGTGHSALSLLRRLPIETLKLDRSFVQDVPQDLRTRAVVQAVTTLAHELGMRVVAEGVETVVQLDAVRALGIDVVQGNYFATALPAADCVAFLTRRGCPPPTIPGRGRRRTR